MTAGPAPAGDERLARAVLSWLAEPGDPQLTALLRTYSPGAIVTALADGTWPPGNVRGPAVPGLKTALQRWTARLGGMPTERTLDGWARAGIRLLCPGDPGWPSQLAVLGDSSPWALWVRGSADLRFACLRSVSIVGTRAATGYGGHVCAELAAALAERGWAVVSGGAFGIDGWAHRGALSAEGITVAVLPSGLDDPYPRGHGELFQAIAAHGVLVSERPPGRAPTRPGFLVRNRLIAALSRGTVVVEAALRSGALNTARHARDLNRPLMAVPGPVTSDLSAGCHSIIRDWQGTLVTGADEAIEALDRVGTGVESRAGSGLPRPPARDPASLPFDVPAAQSPRDRPTWEDAARDALDREAAAVLDALPVRGGLPTSDIAARAGLEPATVLARLAVLAVFGLAERTERGWRARHR